MARHDIPEHGFVKVLGSLSEESGPEGLTLREIFDRLDERSFGVFVLILAVPCLLPGLQGVPQVVALLMLLMAVQVVFGREEPWLPRPILDRRVPKRWIDVGAQFAGRRLAWFERVSRHRMKALACGPGERWAALMIMLGALCIVPPLTNTVPSFGIAFLAVGLIQRDGLFVAIGSVIVAAWAGLIGVFLYGIANGAEWTRAITERFGF